MEGISVSKGLTSTGGVLGAGTGIYCGTSSSVYVKPEFRGKIREKLILAGKEIISSDDSDPHIWGWVSTRYTSYIFFKSGSETKEFEIQGYGITSNANQMKDWCEKELVKDEDKGDYKKAEKWCTKHETLDEHLSSENKTFKSVGYTIEDYDKLSSKLSNSAEDLAFLKDQATNNNQKIARVLLWCNKKSNIDYEGGNTTYSVFKEICGKDNGKK